jgi:hypothetical protein
VARKKTRRAGGESLGGSGAPCAALAPSSSCSPARQGADHPRVVRCPGAAPSCGRRPSRVPRAVTFSRRRPCGPARPAVRLRRARLSARAAPCAARLVFFCTRAPRPSPALTALSSPLARPLADWGSSLAPGTDERKATAVGAALWIAIAASIAYVGSGLQVRLPRARSRRAGASGRVARACRWTRVTLPRITPNRSDRRPHSTPR